MSWESYCRLETNGETIEPGGWSICPEHDDEWDWYSLVYYTSNSGQPMGTHLENCRVIDPVYGQMYPDPEYGHRFP